MDISLIIELIKAVTYLVLSIVLLLLVSRVTWKKIKISCKFFKIKMKQKK